MPFERYANDTITQLDGAITSGQTSITVTNGSGFPDTGDFRILIDTELLLCTARSNNTLTVVRGIEGTTATAHDDSSRVMFILTAESVRKAFSDYWPNVGNMPVPQNLLLKGSTQLLTTSDFTWVNQGTSVASNLDNGNIKIKIPTGTGANIRAFVRSVPTPPYTITMSLSITVDNDGASHMGPVFRESSSGKLYTFAFFGNPNSLRILKYNSPTSFNSDLFGVQNWFPGHRAQWFRMEDDNTDLKFWYSTNGIQWIEVASETRTTFMSGAPDQVGLYGNANSTSIQDSMILTHWSGE